MISNAWINKKNVCSYLNIYVFYLKHYASVMHLLPTWVFDGGHQYSKIKIKLLDMHI